MSITLSYYLVSLLTFPSSDVGSNHSSKIWSISRMKIIPLKWQLVVKYHLSILTLRMAKSKNTVGYILFYLYSCIEVHDILFIVFQK